MAHALIAIQLNWKSTMLFVDISDNSLSLAFYFDGALQIEAQRTANTARIAQVASNMKC